MNVTAKDAMTTPTISVKPDQTLKEVIRVFAKNNISGAPVIDDEEKLVGIITERDIVNFSGKTHIVSLLDTSGWISPHTDVSKIASSREGFEMIAKVKVKSEMTRKVYSVKEETPLPAVARLMKKKKVDRIPVVDDQGHLLGIITRSDIVNKLAEIK